MIKRGTIVHVIHANAVVRAKVLHGSANGRAARVQLFTVASERLWLSVAAIFSNREAATAALTHGPSR